MITFLSIYLYIIYLFIHRSICFPLPPPPTLPYTSSSVYLCTAIKGSIIDELEKHRDAELADLREKRQKLAEEAAVKKKKEDTAKETVAKVCLSNLA